MNVVEPITAARIAVVIPLYNKRATIARAIESVLNQNEVGADLVIVDDGSDDGSGQIAATFEPQVRIVRQGRRGPSAARNAGMRATSASVVTFLDADDEFQAGALASHLRVRALSPQVRISLLGSKSVEDGRTECAEHLCPAARVGLAPSRDNIWGGGFDPRLVFGIPSGSFAVDRQLLDAVGGFDEALHCWEITEFLYRLLLADALVALPMGIGLTLHRDSTKSQFVTTRHNKTYLARFGHSLIDRIESVPTQQRDAVIEKIVIIGRDLIRDRATAEYRSVADRAVGLFPDRRRPRILAFAALPDWGLSCLSLLANRL